MGAAFVIVFATDYFLPAVFVIGGGLFGYLCRAVVFHALLLREVLWWVLLSVTDLFNYCHVGLVDAADLREVYFWATTALSALGSGFYGTGYAHARAGVFRRRILYRICSSFAVAGSQGCWRGRRRRVRSSVQRIGSAACSSSGAASSSDAASSGTAPLASSTATASSGSTVRRFSWLPLFLGHARCWHVQASRSPAGLAHSAQVPARAVIALSVLGCVLLPAVLCAIYYVYCKGRGSRSKYDEAYDSLLPMPAQLGQAVPAALRTVPGGMAREPAEFDRAFFCERAARGLHETALADQWQQRAEGCPGIAGNPAYGAIRGLTALPNVQWRAPPANAGQGPPQGVRKAKAKRFGLTAVIIVGVRAVSNSVTAGAIALTLRYMAAGIPVVLFLDLSAVGDISSLRLRWGGFDYLPWLKWLLASGNAARCGVTIVQEVSKEKVTDVLIRLFKDCERVYCKYLNHGSKTGADLPGGEGLDVRTVGDWVATATSRKTRLCLDFECCFSGEFLGSVLRWVTRRGHGVSLITLLASVRNGLTAASKFVVKGGEWTLYVGPCLRALFRYLLYLVQPGDDFGQAVAAMNGMGYVAFDATVVWGGQALVADFLPLGPAHHAWADAPSAQLGLAKPPACELQLEPGCDDRFVLQTESKMEEARGVCVDDALPEFVAVPVKIIRKFQDGLMASAPAGSREGGDGIGRVLDVLRETHREWFSLDDPPGSGPTRDALYEIIGRYDGGTRYRGVVSELLYAIVVRKSASVERVDGEIAKIAQTLGVGPRSVD
jgi:hypothetical protein